MLFLVWVCFRGFVMVDDFGLRGVVMTILFGRWLTGVLGGFDLLVRVVWVRVV